MDTVILGMSADEPNIYSSHNELHDYNKTEIVTVDIEHVALVTNGIDAIERLTYISEACPMSLPDGFNPFLQCCAACGMGLYKLSQCFFGEYSHDGLSLQPQSYERCSKFQNDLTIFVIKPSHLLIKAGVDVDIVMLVLC